MAGRQADGRQRAGRTAGYVCLAIPVAALLDVPTYAGTRASLFGMPCFYWYQLGWVLLTPLLMLIAYRLLRPAHAGDDIGASP